MEHNLLKFPKEYYLEDNLEWEKPQHCFLWKELEEEDKCKNVERKIKKRI